MANTHFNISRLGEVRRSVKFGLAPTVAVHAEDNHIAMELGASDSGWRLGDHTARHRAGR